MRQHSKCLIVCLRITPQEENLLQVAAIKENKTKSQLIREGLLAAQH